MSSLAGINKIYLFCSKSTEFGHFWLPRSNFKVDFLNVEAKVLKILGHFTGGVVRNIVSRFEFSIFETVHGGARLFANRHIPQTAISAGCIFLGRPFVAYACFMVCFYFS